MKKVLVFFMLAAVSNQVFAQKKLIKSELCTLKLEGKGSTQNYTYKEFNEDGKLTLTRWYHVPGDSAKSRTDSVWRQFEYTYDDHGTVATKVGFENGLETDLTTNCKYNTNGTLSIQEVEGKLEGKEVAYTIAYSYAANSDLKEEIWKANGKQVRQVKYKYDANRRLIEVDADYGEFKTKWTRSFDKLGNITGFGNTHRTNSEFYASGDTMHGMMKYMKNSKNLQVSMIKIAGGQEFWTLYKYEGNLMVEEKCATWKHKPIYRVEFDYNDAKLLSEKRMFDEEDSPTTVFSYAYTFFL